MSIRELIARNPNLKWYYEKFGPKFFSPKGGVGGNAYYDNSLLKVVVESFVSPVAWPPTACFEFFELGGHIPVHN
jgi:hypothetical protein